MTTDTRFNHHDPDIEALMWERAHAQGAAHNAETILGTSVIIGSPIDIAALRAAIQAFTDGITAVMEQVVAAINTYGDAIREVVDMLAKASAKANGDTAHHGAAAICPKHGPTRGGLCRRCTR